MRNQISCPVCRQKNLPQSIVLCGHCQTRYLYAPPTEKEYQSTLELEAEKNIQPATDQNNQKVQADHLALLAKFLKKRASILDVGCGNGVFLDLAKKNGYQIAGQDQSSKIVKHLQKKNFKVFHRLEEVTPLSFDAITLFDVLEHVSQPQIFVQTLAKKLKAGGLLFIATPNSQGIAGRIIKNRFWGLKSTGHLVVYNLPGLTGLLKQNKFKILFSGSETLAWWYLTNSFLLNKIINKIIYPVLLPFKKPIFSHFLGDSLLLISQKH